MESVTFLSFDIDRVLAINQWIPRPFSKKVQIFLQAFGEQTSAASFFFFARQRAVRLRC
jgi:hypothetical protein